MWQRLKAFKHAHRQTKVFIFMWALYMIAILWTTTQAYTRLFYSRGELNLPTIIRISSPDHKSNGSS